MKTAKTFEVPVRLCLGCGAVNDRTTETTGGGHKPVAGDATICVSCGQVSIFNEDLSLRPPTKDEEEALATNENYQRVRKAWESIPRH